MKIHVTQEDICFGTTRSESRCPIALAVKRQTGRIPFVKIDYMNFDGPNAVFRNLPVMAVRFIKAFDNDRPVKPFAFIMEDL